jgi:DNA mismatch endonuclease, patch repair protein
MKDGGVPRRGDAWPSVPEARRRIMRANRRRDTAPELEIRSRLHRMGLRFRVDRPIRIPDGRPIRPDIVFPRQRVAVFVDGCFWHACPYHGTVPRTNADYWIPKIRENQARDQRNVAALEAVGWTTLRFWAHVQPVEAAAEIAEVVRSRAAALGGRRGPASLTA